MYPEAKVDSLKAIEKAIFREIEHNKEVFAMNAKYPYAAMGAGGSIYSNYKWSPTTHTYQEEVVDSIMNSLIARFPDYPPIRALVNDSTLGSYMSAESFATHSIFWKRYSDRFYDSETDTIVRPLDGCVWPHDSKCTEDCGSRKEPAGLRCCRTDA